MPTLPQMRENDVDVTSRNPQIIIANTYIGLTMCCALFQALYIYIDSFKSHLTDKKTKAQGDCHLLKVSEVAHGKASIYSCRLAPDSLL